MSNYISDLVYCLRFVAILLLLSVTQLECKRQDGKIITHGDWKFVARFCFLSEKGRLRYKFVYPEEYKYLSILLYYDDLSQWSAAYPSDKSCKEKVAILEDGVNQIIELDPLYGKQFWPYCENKEEGGIKVIHCELAGKGLKFRSMRERWWFIAVSHCEPIDGTKSGLNLTYNLHLTNGDEDDMLHYEFSADEFYIFPIIIAFFIAYLFMCGMTLLFAVILAKKQLLHSTFKMYIAAIGFWTFSLMLLCISYGKYAETGYEQTGTKLAGRVFGALSEIIFLLMLNLMAKGYSITRGRLPCHSTVKLSVFFSVYVVAYAALFIVEAETFDPALVLYLYESVPGYGLITLRLLAWAWFCYSLFFTLKRFPKRGGFYYPFFVLYTLWFWAGPIVILIAMFAMALWTREKTVVGVENFVALTGHIFFLILTRPTKASDNFPYTIKTTQIGLFEGKEGESGGAGGDQYAVTTETVDAQGPDLTQLFTTSYESRSMYTNGGFEKDLEVEGNLESEFRNAPPPSYSSIISNSAVTNTRGNALAPLGPPSGRLPPLQTNGLGGAPLPDLRASPSAPPLYPSFTVSQ